VLSHLLLSARSGGVRVGGSDARSSGERPSPLRRRASSFLWSGLLGGATAGDGGDSGQDDNAPNIGASGGDGTPAGWAAALRVAEHVELDVAGEALGLFLAAGHANFYAAVDAAAPVPSSGGVGVVSANTSKQGGKAASKLVQKIANAVPGLEGAARAGAGGGSAVSDGVGAVLASARRLRRAYHAAAEKWVAASAAAAEAEAAKAAETRASGKAAAAVDSGGGEGSDGTEREEEETCGAFRLSEANGAESSAGGAAGGSATVAVLEATLLPDGDETRDRLAALDRQTGAQKGAQGGKAAGGLRGIQGGGGPSGGPSGGSNGLGADMRGAMSEVLLASLDLDSSDDDGDAYIDFVEAGENGDGGSAEGSDGAFGMFGGGAGFGLGSFLRAVGPAAPEAAIGAQPDALHRHASAPAPCAAPQGPAAPCLQPRPQRQHRPKHVSTGATHTKRRSPPRPKPATPKPASRQSFLGVSTDLRASLSSGLSSGLNSGLRSGLSGMNLDLDMPDISELRGSLTGVALPSFDDLDLGFLSWGGGPAVAKAKNGAAHQGD